MSNQHEKFSDYAEQLLERIFSDGCSLGRLEHKEIFLTTMTPFFLPKYEKEEMSLLTTNSEQHMNKILDWIREKERAEG